MSSARIFFRADLTAAEEDEQKEAEGIMSSMPNIINSIVATTVAAEGGNKPAEGENNENSGQPPPPPPPSDPGAHWSH